MSSLSIFMPFYNDAGSVKLMIEDAYKYGAMLTNDLEVITVNDGSKDHTLDQLNQLKKLHPSLIIVNHEKNRGYGGALKSGIKQSSKEWVFYTDGDAQYRLDELHKLWEIKESVTVVNGYKSHRSDNFLRRLVGHTYRVGTKALFRLPLRDVDCDFRLMRGDLLRSLQLKSDSGAITVELVRKLADNGATFSEVPVNHYSRIYGDSTFFTPRRVLKTILDELELIRELKNSPKKI